MTLPQYHKRWKEDCIIDNSQLDAAAQDVPVLHARWWEYYTTERLRFKLLDQALKILKRQKWEWYTNKLDDKERIRLGWQPNALRVLDKNVSVYMDADPDIQEQIMKCAVQEELLRFLEDVIKNINNRGYLLRTTTDFLKFKMGV